jgi:heme/copper-type cytochrome/quinol oxidase subunit 4
MVLNKKKKRLVKWRKIKRKFKKLRLSLKKRLKARKIHILILLACIILTYIAFTIPVDKVIKRQIGLRWHLYCFMDDFFGIKCASCALARSITAFTRGNFLKAFKYYQLGPLIIIYIIFQIPYRLYALIKIPKPLPKPILMLNALMTIALISLIIIDWLFIIGGQV